MRLFAVLFCVLVALDAHADRRVFNFNHWRGGAVSFASGEAPFPTLETEANVFYLDPDDADHRDIDGSNYINGIWSIFPGLWFESTSTNRPLLVDDVLNGHAVIRFDGSNDYLKSTDGPYIATEGAFTVIAVVANRRASGYGGIIASTNAGTNASPSIVLGDTTFGFRGSGGSTGGEITKTVSADTWALFSFVNNGRGNVSYVYQDGNASGSSFTFSNANSDSSAETWLGTYRCTSADWGQLDIAALLVADDALSTSDREAVEDYYISRFGL